MLLSYHHPAGCGAMGSDPDLDQEKHGLLAKIFHCGGFALAKRLGIGGRIRKILN
jgi:hypothetical protein